MKALGSVGGFLDKAPGLRWPALLLAALLLWALPASAHPGDVLRCAATTTGGNWLTATPRSGTGNATIDVAVNSAALAAGHRDEELFELTVATALGASRHRLSAALRALGRE